MKEDYDGAEPTASSVSVLNLRCSRTWSPMRAVGRSDRADAMASRRGSSRWPRCADDGCRAVDLSRRRQQIVIAEGEGGDALDRFISMRHLPFAIQLRVTPEAQRALAASLPFLASMQPLAGVTAAYVCRDFTCRQPVTTVDALEQELGITA
jgi:uncharacterized protein YyaL (SSP411 family)